MRCQHCGADLAPGVRFCSNCGGAQPLPPQPAAEFSSSPPARRSRGGSCGCLLGAGLLALALFLCAAVAVGGLWFWPDLESVVEAFLTPESPSTTQVSPPVTDRQTVQVGIQGGELSCASGARATFPADLFDHEVAVTMDTAVSAPPLPVEFLASPAGQPVDITLPPGESFDGLVDLLIPLERQAGASDDLYTVFQWDGAGWSDAGGVVEGDQIRVQVTHFSTFQPVIAYQPRRPVGFTNHGPYDATVRPWTYVPADANTPTPPSSASTATFAPGAPGGWPNPSRFLSLPLGEYTFCVQWTDGRDADGDGVFDYYHYITAPAISVTANDATSTDLAREVDVDTEGGQAGTCGSPPLLVSGVAADPSAVPADFDYSALPRRPLGFVNHGPHNAGVRAQTYVPAGLDRPVPPPAASTVSFAPGGGGLWPNSSRFLTLPIGTYTFCVDWTTGEDEDENGYFDYFHKFTEPLTLTADDPESLDLARQMDIDTEGGLNGPCNPFGGEGGAAVELPPGAGDVTVRLTWSTVDDLDLHVVEPGGSEIYYNNRRGGQGGRLDRDANPGCGEGNLNPIENVFWPTGEAPEGEYTVSVHYYADCDAYAQVQFRLRVMADDRVIFDQTQQLNGQNETFTFTFVR